MGLFPGEKAHFQGFFPDFRYLIEAVLNGVAGISQEVSMLGKVRCGAHVISLATGWKKFSKKKLAAAGKLGSILGAVEIPHQEQPFESPHSSPLPEFKVWQRIVSTTLTTGAQTS